MPLHVSDSITNVTNNYVLTTYLRYSGIIYLPNINNVCIDLSGAQYAEIDCDGFEGTEIIQCTLEQNLDFSVCRNFYLTAHMIYNAIKGKWVCRVWLWGDLVDWEERGFAVFVNIFQNVGCVNDE